LESGIAGGGKKGSFDTHGDSFCFGCAQPVLMMLFAILLIRYYKQRCKEVPLDATTGNEEFRLLSTLLKLTINELWRHHRLDTR
jgi:hypothetical protein